MLSYVRYVYVHVRVFTRVPRMRYMYVHNSFELMNQLCCNCMRMHMI